jgi:hypothetical protein
MTVEIETVELIEPWLYSTLSGDSTLSGLVGGRITSTLNPLSEGVQVPFVYFGFASQRDIPNASGFSLDTESYYNVKGVALGNTYTGTLLSIAKRIHVLINGKTPTFSPSGSLTCVREQILQYPEVPAGVEYRHLGGLYRIRCSAV